MQETKFVPRTEKTIIVKEDVYRELESLKVIPRESFSDCIVRIIRENQTYHNPTRDIQTKKKMEDEIKDFVLNPEIPDPNEQHKKIWLQTHPGERINPGEIIHHINGNHGDNRPENLLKVTEKEHGKCHSELNKKYKEQESK